MQIKMVVTGLTIDPSNNAPIVLLRDEQAGHVLPISIGVIEASAIAFELEKVHLTRPMTHDLLKTAIEGLGGVVERVCIVDLRESTYYAIVVLRQNDRQIEIDARPSDAIALALRTQAAIFCDKRVVVQARARSEVETGALAGVPPPVKVDEDRGEEDQGDTGPRPIVDVGRASTRDLLEQLAPEDFGKYKM